MFDLSLWQKLKLYEILMRRLDGVCFKILYIHIYTFFQDISKLCFEINLIKMWKLSWMMRKCLLNRCHFHFEN